MRVLHVAKVTGIAGAENHLLALLPACTAPATRTSDPPRLGVAADPALELLAEFCALG